MNKFYNRQTVAYKFKWEMLKKIKGSELSQKQKEALWEAFKILLKQSSKISEHQAKTWKYPSDLIKNA